MALSQENIEQLKSQIINQIESNFPEEKKKFAIEKINLMDDATFIEFLKKNNLLSSESDESEKNKEEKNSHNKNPFRLIVEKKIPSYTLEENKEAIAVLEIKPISKGHIIIIPKKPISDPNKITKQILSMANKISKKIKNKLKPKEVLISPILILGEIIINILPIYNNESLDSEKKEISQEELEELKKILEKKHSLKKEKKLNAKTINETKLWIPRRIP